MYGGSARRNVPFGARGLKRPASAAASTRYDALELAKRVEKNGMGGQRKDKKYKVSAVQRRQHLVVGISTEGSTISTDGSEFSIDLNKFPLNVPKHAFNVGIRLVDLVIPYVWPNFNNTTSEKLTIEFEDEKDFLVEDLQAFGIFNISNFEGSSGTEVYGYSGGVTTDTNTDAYSSGGIFDTRLTEKNELAEQITGKTEITASLANITGGVDFVQHFVWEEKDASGNGADRDIEVIYDATFYQVFRKVNTESGFQELWIRFYQSATAWFEKRLTSRYQMNKTNVLTVVFDQSADKAFVIYNDSVILNGDVISSGTVSPSKAHTWLATTGMHIPSDALLLAFFHHVSAASAGAPLFNQGTTDTLSLGYPSDKTAGSMSFWHQHAVLMNKYKSYNLTPHIKLNVAGLSSASTDYSAGATIDIPILHENDNSLSFVTIPTLLGYMQKVLNQFIFREFFFSNFLSVDLIENHTSLNGTNYLVQFDYDLRRSASVATLPSAFTMNSALYPTNGNKMKVDLSPCPYFFYENDASDSPDLITIAYNGSTYNFDPSDLEDLGINPQYSTGDDGRDYLVLARSDVARFVYESLRVVFREQGHFEPAPWASRSSQPSNSPIEFISEMTAADSMDIDDTGADPENVGSWRIKFKDPANFVDEDGAATLVTSLSVNLSNLQNQVGGAGNLGDTTNVSASYSPDNAHGSSATVIQSGASNSLYLNIFQKMDTLTVDVTVEDGVYNLDYFNAYIEKEMNDFFHASTHGSGGESCLVKLLGDPFTQQVQIGALLTTADPDLPSRARFTFPAQKHGSIATVDTISDNHSDHTNGTHQLSNASGDGSGTGANFTITVSEGNVTNVSISKGGSKFVLDETITIPTSVIGGSGSETFDVASIENTNNGVAQMLYNGLTVTLEDDDSDGMVVSAGGGNAGGYEYTGFLEDYTSSLLSRPTYDDQNSQLITLDYSRVISDFTGISHTVDPRDEGSRVFDFNPFTAETDLNDKSLETNTYTIEIPTGSYNAESLGQMIDYLLRQQNPEILPNILSVRRLQALQKLQFGALVSSDPNNAFPHKVTIKSIYNNEAPTKLAALLGWDLSDGDIVITAPDYRETNSTITPIYSNYFANQQNFETRSIFLLSNFSRNATSPNGDPLQIVCAFAPRAQPGENIIINPNQPIISDAATYLKENNLDELRFKLVDGLTKEALAIGTNTNDAYTVTIAIEYDESVAQEEIMRPADQISLSTGV